MSNCHIFEYAMQHIYDDWCSAEKKDQILIAMGLFLNQVYCEVGVKEYDDGICLYMDEIPSEKVGVYDSLAVNSVSVQTFLYMLNGMQEECKNEVCTGRKYGWPFIQGISGLVENLVYSDPEAVKEFLMPYLPTKPKDDSQDLFAPVPDDYEEPSDPEILVCNVPDTTESPSKNKKG